MFLRFLNRRSTLRWFCYGSLVTSLIWISILYYLLQARKGWDDFTRASHGGRGGGGGEQREDFQANRKRLLHRESNKFKSILPSSPSDDERENEILSNDFDDDEYPRRNDNNNNNNNDYPRRNFEKPKGKPKFGKDYEEIRELQRMKARREQELARRKNDVLPPREDGRRKGQMEVMKVGDWEKKSMDEIGMILNPDDERKRDQGMKQHAFNELISQRLSLHRPVPDTRNPLCKSLRYPNLSLLPTVSVVICFYNEAWSTLLRSVQSVLDRSPPPLLREIILIDDYSDLPHLQAPLKDFLSKEYSNVFLHRTEKREGLIRARLFGAEKARAKVLVFLDSHVEVNVQWLEPLVTRIYDDPTTVAVPIIDIVSSESFKYTSSPLVRGGFNWGLHFKWDPVPPELLKTKADYIKPIATPTMAGGLFAIDRQFFQDMGSYDPGMNIWGGENLEISFRTWQCGGRLEILPCSRVGHVFRKRRPYGSPDGQDTNLFNSLRAAHVWMDDFIERFFELRPNARSADYGDVSDRRALRDKLQCKPFEWYMKTVYPQLLENRDQVPVMMKDPNQALRSSAPRGLLRSLSSDSCVGARESDVVFQKKRPKVAELFLEDCPPRKAGEKRGGISKSKMWTFTAKNELFLATIFCLDADAGYRLMKMKKVDDYSPANPPGIQKCHGNSGTQEWTWHPVGPQEGGMTGRLYSPSAGKCLKQISTPSREYLDMAICGEGKDQLWQLVLVQ